MHKLLSVAFAGVFVFGGQALAADLPMKSAPVAVTGFDWSGVYIGGHLGGGWERSEVSDPSAFNNMLVCCFLLGNFSGPSAAPKTNGSSFLGGAQIGTMYQIGRLVVGADFDWSGTSLKGSTTSSFTPNASAALANDTYSVKTNWTASATTTVGIARDRWMIYGKAGVAWENVNYGLNIAGVTSNFGADLPFAFAAATTSTVTGWTVGTGVKWAVSDNWFVNAEYDYMDFGTKTPNLAGTAIGASIPAGQGNLTFTPNIRQNVSEVKVGLNYKFGPGLLFW